MADGPRYGFHPLERRGLLLGLDGVQVATLGGGAASALAARAAIGGRLGLVAALATAAGALAAGLGRKDGTSFGRWARLGAGWASRRTRGPLLDDRPLVGTGPAGSAVDGSLTAGRPTQSPGRARRRAAGTTAPAGIEIACAPGIGSEAGIGMVVDRAAGTQAAVLPVHGGSFSLLDPPEQAQRLEAWRRVLGAVARPGTPVTCLQWVRRTRAGSTPALDSMPVAGPDEDVLGAAASYRSFVTSALPGMVDHHTWLVLAVPGRRRSSSTVLRREVRFLQGQLESAGLEPGPPLTVDRLCGVLADTTRCGGSPPATGRAGLAWPMAAHDGWAAYRADGTWHVTYWVAEWPRVEVGPDFLSPLLVAGVRTSVSVLMAPVAAAVAVREVRSARTADLADAALRSRAGFLTSARRERESEGPARREEELADGHQAFRFSGYVTVSADDPEGLAAACADVEHLAQSARVELRRLFGRQREAFTWTLPLARGLR